MKKLVYSSLFVIAAMTTFSCSKEVDVKDDVDNTGVKNPLVITAYTDDDIVPDTKTTLSGVNVVWSSLDAIAGYTDTGTPITSTATAISEGGKKATFTFDALTVEDDLYYLIYPFSAAGDEDGGYYNITLPTEQTATANGFANGANIALAEGGVADDAVQFKNLGALIGLTINNDNIESVKISANEGMTGAGLVDPSSYEAIENSGAKYVQLTGGLENGTQYYAVVYPSPLAGYSGLQIVATNTLGQTATFTNSNNLVLERNDNVQIANLTIADSKWYPALTQWTYTFPGKVYSANGAQTLNGKSWTLAGNGGYWGTGSSAQQFGSGSAPYTNLSLTANFGAGEGIKSVAVKAFTALDSDATLSISVGGTAFKNASNTSVNLSTTQNTYVFSSPDGKVKTGDIIISMPQTTSKALYIKTITVNGKDDPELSFGTPSYSLELESSEYTAFTGQAVANPHSLTISYVSSDETIATVDGSGNITLKGKAGSTTITASSSEDAIYNAGEASYTIEVTEIQGLPYSISLISSTIGKFTYDEDGWSTSGYGITAQGTSIGEDYWLISPVIDMRTEETACLLFDHAANGVGALATDCTLYAKQVGGDWSTLTIKTMPSNDSWTFVSSGKIDLNAYAGKKMQIGFKYHSTNTTGKWEIKNFNITKEDVSRTAATLAFANASMELTTLSDDTANVATTNSDATVTYSSDDESVVTISSTGVVSVAGAGTTIIRAHVEKNASYTAADAECEVTVSKVKLTTPSATAAKSGDDAIVVSWTENDALVASYKVNCTGQDERNITKGTGATTTFTGLSDGSYTVTVVAVPSNTAVYANSDAYTSSSIMIGTPTPSALYSANFEGSGERQTDTSKNNYTTEHSYTVSGVLWTLLYADAVSNANRLDGSGDILARVKKNTTNSPYATTGNVLSASKTITKVSFLSKLGTNITLSVSYSTNGGSTWSSLTVSKDTTVDATNGYSATVSDVTTSNFSLKFQWTISSADSKNNVDSQLDDIVIYGY